MLMTVSELRKHLQSEATDEELTLQLRAVEAFIRSYTNNGFQQHAVDGYCDHDGRLILPEHEHVAIGDTLQISESLCNRGLYTVMDKEGHTLTLDVPLSPENNVVVSKVVYPPAIRLGSVRLVKWAVQMTGKAGIQSETISRHSVTYAGTTDADSAGGYPKSMIGFLKPYRRGRFGRGVVL